MIAPRITLRYRIKSVIRELELIQTIINENYYGQKRKEMDSLAQETIKNLKQILKKL